MKNFCFLEFCQQILEVGLSLQIILSHEWKMWILYFNFFNIDFYILQVHQKKKKEERYTSYI